MDSISVPFSIIKLSEEAILPTRAHDTDVGFDVSVHSMQEGLTAGQHGLVYGRFHTHLRIRFYDPTWYAELYARSSLHKHGFLLANGVGIIDPSYQGELLVALCPLPNWIVYEYESKLNTLEYPARVAQLVFKQRNFLGTLRLEEALADEVETERGTGGFGSTQ